MLFSEFMKTNTVILDGAMGTVLQSKGLLPGELPERWNISHPDVITAIHRAYYDAGSHVVSANTFGANGLKYDEKELEEIISAAVKLVKKAKEESSSAQEKFIALDVGPLGKLLKPLGEMDFEEAVLLFKKSISLGVKYGVDLIFIQTMTDSLETKAALLAAKETCSKPVIVCNAYGEDGKLMTGASPENMVTMLEAMGADAIGANCSLGPDKLAPVVETLLKWASVPVILKPNAGLPREENGKTVFDISPETFGEEVVRLAKKGVRLVGGCCGTTPEYIKRLTEGLKDAPPVAIKKKERTAVSSYCKTVSFGEEPILIGERINPTGKKRFREALIQKDMDYILSEGISQEEKGVHILDVNVGIPDINEAEMLEKTVCALQSVTPLPLQIDSASPEAMEKALRRYNGKAMINSVNGKKESMEKIFPLVKKYGGVVVALTLDETGIPADADGRVEIAKKILDCAKEYGIEKKDIIFDTLAMTVSADDKAAVTTLEALKRIRTELGCHTSLGVSNISFGLPCRDAITSTFFAMALENGLSGAIMNPFSADMMKTYHCYRTLKGWDEKCLSYVSAAEEFPQNAAVQKKETASENESFSDLENAIYKGRKERAREICHLLSEKEDPLAIVREHIVPALDRVGIGFEEKRIYLPGLLMSAEAAKEAFEVIRARMEKSGSKEKKATVVLATVKGDIHDIGKNIVKLLLENYDFQVVDLGKDVPPEAIVNAALETKAPIVGLSALMTTTVPAMEETIRRLKKEAPFVRVMVGGAVLTKEYAQKIGADAYAKDAMEAVRVAEDWI